MAYQGKFSGSSSSRRPRRKQLRPSRTLVLALVLALLTGTVAGTLAYLFTQTSSLTNTFTPASVPNTPVEEFTGTQKSSIRIQNTGNIPAYIRVKLVTYRVDDARNHIGGEATIPGFKLGTNWMEIDGYYYYTQPVDPEALTSNLLGTSITLKAYDDADGGKQVIEVISESIQSQPTHVVEDSWKDVKVGEDGNLTQKGGN